MDLSLFAGYLAPSPKTAPWCRHSGDLRSPTASPRPSARRDGEGILEGSAGAGGSIVEEGNNAWEAARLLNVGASTAIRWIERWTTTGWGVATDN